MKLDCGVCGDEVAVYGAGDGSATETWESACQTADGLGHHSS